jgi:hypothetical protein
VCRGRRSQHERQHRLPHLASLIEGHGYYTVPARSASFDEADVLTGHIADDLDQRDAACPLTTQRAALDPMAARTSGPSVHSPREGPTPD